MLCINDYRLYTLQYYLYNTLNKADEIHRLIGCFPHLDPSARKIKIW